MAALVIEAAERFRRALLTKQATTAGRLTRAYGRIFRDLSGEIDDLLASLWDAETMTYRRSVKLARLRSLKSQIASEIDRYGVFADTEMLEGARDAIGSAGTDSRTLTQLSLPLGLQEAGIMSQWHRLPTDAVESLMGFLGPDSPLHDALIKQLGAEVADRVGDAMVKAIALGWNPTRTAALITKSGWGQGLTWSMKTVRTAQLWAYREGTRANYIANSRIVRSWTWSAALDVRTCMSCVALHGSVHPVTETLNDHHNGRCAMIPNTVTYRDLGLDVDTPELEIESGRDWFKEQPEAMQQQMMGQGMWDAWQGNQFAFDKLSQPYDDKVYGVMRRQATLGEVLG